MEAKSSTGIDFFEMFNAWLKEESRDNLISNLTNITINDFIPEKIEEYETYMQQKIKNNFETQSLREVEENSKKNISPLCTLEKLKPERRKELNLLIDEYAKALFELRKNAFYKGSSLMQLNLITKELPLFVTTENDFNLSLEEKQCLRSSKTSFTLSESLENLGRNIRAKKIEQRKDINLIKKSIDYFAEFDSLDLAHSHYFQLKWYLLVSKKSKISLGQLTWEDVCLSREEFTEIIEHVKAQKEKMAKKLGDELIAKENLEKKVKITKGKSQKSRQKLEPKAQAKKEESKPPKIESVPLQISAYSPFQSLIQKANLRDNKPLYAVHSRVKRWGTPFLETIKRFQDFNFSTQTWEMPYANCTDLELLKLKNRHNLSGIEHLLSEFQFKDQYTFPYKYKDKKTEEIKEGIGIYAVMKVKDEIESGILHVGIGEDGVIYHIFFDSITEKHLFPEHIARVMGNFEMNPIHENDKFHLTASYIFSLKEENILTMEIGSSSEDRVTFLFYPL